MIPITTSELIVDQLYFIYDKSEGTDIFIGAFKCYEPDDPSLTFRIMFDVIMVNDYSVRPIQLWEESSHVGYHLSFREDIKLFKLELEELAHLI